jgi:DNA-binding NarL/FixJ family response regulator
MKNNSIRILVVDDHRIVRTGLKALFASEKGLEVVAEADDGASALRVARELAPDVAVVDLMMPGMDGAETIARLGAEAPATRTLVLTSCDSSDVLSRALAAGASGAVLKTSDDESLLTGVREVAAGRRFLSPEVRRLLSQDPPVAPFTPRQSEVLESLTRGFTNADIARQLGICEASVEEHVKAILAKVGAANRTEAVAIALRKHLLKI